MMRIRNLWTPWTLSWHDEEDCRPVARGSLDFGDVNKWVLTLTRCLEYQYDAGKLGMTWGAWARPCGSLRGLPSFMSRRSVVRCRQTLAGARSSWDSAIIFRNCDI